MSSRRPLLVVTPHNSGHVPQDVLRQMLGESAMDPHARSERARHLFEQGDPYTDVIFQAPGAHHLSATVSRFVVDLNRTKDEGGANGVIKMTDFDAQPLYPNGFVLEEFERQERLCRYWDPFHLELDRVIEGSRIRLLIDGHSMTPSGPAIGPDAGRFRPAITLMTAGDERGEAIDAPGPTISPPRARELREAADRHLASFLAEAGPLPTAEVALNRPWSTDEICRMHSASGRVPGFGIEINRALYLEPSGAGEQPIEGRVPALQRWFAAFAEEAMTIVEGRSLRGST